MPDSAEETPLGGTRRVQVGAWTVEPHLNQISAGGQTLKLEPKAMALLRYLAERPGQVVSREALLSALWPGVIVGDDSLTQAVIKLRKAMGDTVESGAYVQTISKGGYRLVAPVVRLDGSTTTSVESEWLRGRWKTHIPSIVAAIVTALLLAAAGFWWATDDGVSSGPATTARTEAARAAQPTVSIRPFDTLGDNSETMLLARG